jgi:hypothetical protein
MHTQGRVLWLVSETVEPVVHCNCARECPPDSSGAQRTPVHGAIGSVWFKYDEYSIAGKAVDVTLEARYEVHHNRKEGCECKTEALHTLAA